MKFKSNLINHFLWLHSPPPLKKNSSSNSVASMTEPKNDRWNMYHKELISIKKDPGTYRALLTPIPMYVASHSVRLLYKIFMYLTV
jgi:hypothetical protein